MLTARRTAVPLALAAASVVAAGSQALAAPPKGAWTSSVPALTRPAALYGVAAPKRQVAWTVGSEAKGTKPVVLRWDGTTWKRDAVPGGIAPEIVGVASNGKRNAWAIAQSGAPDDARSLHWDGLSWKAVPYPLPLPLAVSVDSGGTAWSAGCAEQQNDCAVLQYKGGQWVRHPALPLATVAARTPRDVWAGGAGDWTDKTGLRHYDGRTWTKVEFPTQWSQWILQIVPVSAREVWVYTLPQDPLFSGPTLMRLKDGVWTEHKPPRPTVQARASIIGNGFLGRIAPDGRGGVWLQTNQTDSYQHFDGTSWTKVPRSLPFDGAPFMYGLAQVGSSRTVLGAGYGGAVPVIERFR
ncbi:MULTISPECIES: hypothetical protein [Actinomadura]|uniref:Secreted protein n=1 Tax=Actinomadura yumaensis TaxID=111807 RepID=A0ABW2CGU9_9ACTN|nr:hypothetical protein [Actinomadura sp. J1-007]MWK34525.1 hypothetical protein [Actinomadura sp. J1-007]